MAVRLVVSGATGRMGAALGRLATEGGDLRVVGGIVRRARPAAGYPEVRAVADAADLIGRADVVIDVSAPDQLGRLLDLHGRGLAGRGLVVGTTGLGGELEARLNALSTDAAVLVAANFSVGVNVLMGLVEQAARALPAEGYDIEVVETHHRRKEDAPSGTALALGRAAAAGRGGNLEALRQDGRSGRTGARPAGQIGFHAVRGGGVAGEHEVRLLGELERITLSHAASSRDLFAEGALVAARWLAGRAPGRYRMAHVLGLGGVEPAAPG